MSLLLKKIYFTCVLVTKASEEISKNFEFRWLMEYLVARLMGEELKKEEKKQAC